MSVPAGKEHTLQLGAGEVHGRGVSRRAGPDDYSITTWSAFLSLLIAPWARTSQAKNRCFHVLTTLLCIFLAACISGFALTPRKDVVVAAAAVVAMESSPALERRVARRREADSLAGFLFLTCVGGRAVLSRSGSGRIGYILWRALQVES